MSRNLSDWISGYMQFTEKTEPPTLFRMWTAISVVASVLQRKCSLPWGLFSWYPNMYIVLVAPSGGRKGTAMGPGMGMLEELQIKLAAEATTREALIRELKNVNDTIIHSDSGKIEFHSSLTIFSQELTVFLGHHNFQLMSDLCDWYDCRNKWTYRTKHQGTDDIIGIWVNLIGGTTPELIRTMMPLEAIGGGLTSRMIFVYEESKSKTISRPFLTQEELDLYKKLLIDLEQIHLIQGHFELSEGLLEKWDEWYPAQDKNPPFKDQRFDGYLTRRPMHAMKLAMILRASRRSRKGEPEMLIDRLDFERAVDILEQTEVKMRYTFSGVGKSKYAEILPRIMQEIALKGRITKSELSRRFCNDVDSYGFDNLLASMESMKFIRVVHRGTIQEIECIDPEFASVNTNKLV